MQKHTEISCRVLGILFSLVVLIGSGACSPIASNMPKNFARGQPQQQNAPDSRQTEPTRENVDRTLRIRIVNFQTRLISASANEPNHPTPLPAQNKSNHIDYALSPEQLREFLADGILRLTTERGQNALDDLEKAEIGEIELTLSMKTEEILRETVAERSPLKGLRVILKYDPENLDSKSEIKKTTANEEALASTLVSSSRWVLILARRHQEGVLPRLRHVLTGMRIKATTEIQPSEN